MKTPDYYAGNIQPIDLIESLGLGEAFAKASIIKYIARAGQKEFDPLSDLMKAKFYLDRLIEKAEDAPP